MDGTKNAEPSHCSPESNLVKKSLPETLTIDSESSWHGDFKNNLGFRLAINATFKKKSVKNRELINLAGFEPGPSCMRDQRPNH